MNLQMILDELAAGPFGPFPSPDLDSRYSVDLVQLAEISRALQQCELRCQNPRKLQPSLHERQTTMLKLTYSGLSSQ